MNTLELKQKNTKELLAIAEEHGLKHVSRQKKADIIFNILKTISKDNKELSGGGILETLPDGFGFLRSPWGSYLAGPDDVYVSPSQIRKFNLRTGDFVVGKIRPPREQERYFALVQVDTINDNEPSKTQEKIAFENLTPLFPDDRFRLETGSGSSEDISPRIIDLVAPIGKGQRGLIVSPPKAGKTLLLQNLAQSIVKNSPETHVIVLLIDERPEEVTDMQRTVDAEVVASTFDESPQRHVQVADLVIEKAKRLVEHKKDVVILLDSITRLGRAYNTVQPASGKILSGGVDSNALERPKRFYGAARNIEEGGSLTIIATALVDTGSRLDDLIYEEFKGTGNMELHLDRGLAERRIWPAINIEKSGTRHEELLQNESTLSKITQIRRIMAAFPSDNNEKTWTEKIVDGLKAAQSNQDFLDNMQAYLQDQKD